MISQRERLRITINGAVQGVGFRPFIYRLASDLDLPGWVYNSSQGVFIEVEGSRPCLETFLQRIEREKPPLALIQQLDWSFDQPVGYERFEIQPSDSEGDKTALVLPDIATCPDCLREIFDPGDRRYQYPFTNCTNCGPRYSIIEALPYDRPSTTMRRFEMCHDCRDEYEHPVDRRFHAQPNACPICGPHLELWNSRGQILAAHHDALMEAANAIRQGKVVAIKGLGGFHLMADARNEDAVQCLRMRKHREEKPFALMFPTLASIHKACEVSSLEATLLSSPQAPIVLLRRKMTADIALAVAPGNPHLGVMLPYTPLHHLLMAELGFPVVATSGNLSDEPICTDEHDALDRLNGIADLFLVHDRPITRHIDDSIVCVMAGREMILRRARGYAPLPIHVDRALPSLLAVGAHLKNTIAISKGQEIFVSQHIGDLETAGAFEAFQQTIASFESLYELSPAAVACDMHPDYLSTQFAQSSGQHVIAVQHHYAHVLTCMADNRLDPPVLGIVWDGTGYGPDETVWGGEFLRVTADSYERAAHFRTFRLPGGDRAMKEPRRTAIGLLYEIFGDELFNMTELAPLESFSIEERAILQAMLTRDLNSPFTSSAGRLFDAVAALLNLRQIISFEGQAAMELQFALDGVVTDEHYDFALTGGREPVIIDWEMTVRGILRDVRDGLPPGVISARFHNTLVEIAVGVARQIGEDQIALTGGCFQNKVLTERLVERLRSEGFHPYWHREIPPNDGGIAVGQIIAAAREFSNEE